MSGQKDAPIIIETGAAPAAACIWLHGLGADGYDFEPVVMQLNLNAPVRFILPHAPVRPVTLNGGMPMRAWFDIVSLNLEAEVDQEGIEASSEQVLQMADAQPLPVFFAGFSQGGLVALHAALKQKQSPLGVLALSTWYPLSVPENRLNIFMGHGELDDIVPVALAQKTAQRLQQQGAHVDWHVYAMGHSVCPQELVAIEHWLNRQLERVI